MKSILVVLPKLEMCSYLEIQLFWIHDLQRSLVFTISAYNKNIFLKTIIDKKTTKFFVKHFNNNNRFMALCLGLPGWAGTRINIHPPTILIIIQSLSGSSIYHDPQHPPCSNYVLGNLFAQPHSVLKDPFHHFHSMFQQFNPPIRSTLHWITFPHVNG